MATRRRKDIRIRYSSDRDNTEIIIAQRVYGVGSATSGATLTPITPKLSARIVPGIPVDRTHRIEPRYVNACVPNYDNSIGESNLKVVIPYLPGTDDHFQHIKEIANYSDTGYNVAAVTYFSEAKKI